MTIIALTGYKQSGKSSVARTLQEQFGFTRMAFADPVKWAVQMIYGLSYDQLYGHLKEEPDPRYDLTPRFIMQHFGTEVCRHLHPDTWVLNLKRRMDYLPGQSNVVIDDLRFDNEAKAVREWGGKVWRVARFGYGRGQHASEAYSPFADLMVVNDGSLEELANWVSKEMV